MQGGCGGVCHMGTRHICILGFLGGVIIFQEFETCVYISMPHLAPLSAHENYKANKTCQEKEEKDASSIVNVVSLALL